MKKLGAPDNGTSASDLIMISKKTFSVPKSEKHATKMIRQLNSSFLPLSTLSTTIVIITVLQLFQLRHLGGVSASGVDKGSGGCENAQHLDPNGTTVLYPNDWL